MNPPKPDSPQQRRTILDLVKDKSGVAPKVLLSDSDSEVGTSPIVDPKGATVKLVPQGRGNYQLLGEIARGGMGVILKGHDTDLGRDVAVKVLGKDLATNPAIVQRFIEEAQIGGQLQHPGIVPVYELGLMADDCPYFTMKLVKGRTLAALLTQRATPADDRGKLLTIFESVCQTMAYAHSKGVLHRDLKPANIMVGAFGEVQVVDWGLAKVLRRGGVADEKRAKQSLHTVIETVRSAPRGQAGSSGSDSMVGSVMGTPAYMAPEQAAGEVEKLDERADVFSLGAILCELLTGHPPYEDNGTDSVVVQAAHAMLDPARARIEASDADPALKKLCLGCLMPAKAARPANAEAVAKALHDYLSSVEARAQEARLDAEKARIQAAEEKRRRRLTVALAGTAAAALLLGGGGWFYVSNERAKRLEQTRTVVEAAYGESIELAQAKKPAEALVAAKKALTLAESGGADAALLERAHHFVEKADAEATAAERERALLEQDETLRARLIDLRLEQVATLGDAKKEAELDAAFTQAFRDYGVDLEGEDVVPAMKRLRERAFAEEVALTLDDWARLRRRVHGAQSEKVENLYLLATDLDPDPLRAQMREAIATNDRVRMLELTSPENLPKLGPGSIFVLCAALWGGTAEEQQDVFRIFERAVHLYPHDYALQALAGAYYGEGFRFASALACRTAALGLRPNDVATRVKVADSQYRLGLLTEALATLRVCLAADPTNAEGNDLQGLIQVLLGDYPGALASLARAPGIRDDPGSLADLHAAEYYNGVIGRDEVKRLMDGETLPIAMAAYLFALVDHPDPKQRDPEYVLRALEERSGTLSPFRWPATVEILARMRLEDWSGALLVLEGRFKPQLLMLVTPMTYEFWRTRIYARLGRTVEAEQAYKRGLLAWDEQTADHPELWARSDAMRWRKEAEAALAK
ncbi:MAG: protein kinase [Planctomycetes bacterium]|nr:protein kinase [Planctomycetota bacterium]